MNARLSVSLHLPLPLLHLPLPLPEASPIRVREGSSPGGNLIPWRRTRRDGYSGINTTATAVSADILAMSARPPPTTPHESTPGLNQLLQAPTCSLPQLNPPPPPSPSYTGSRKTVRQTATMVRYAPSPRHCHDQHAPAVPRRGPEPLLGRVSAHVRGPLHPIGIPHAPVLSHLTTSGLALRQFHPHTDSTPLHTTPHL